MKSISITSRLLLIIFSPLLLALAILLYPIWPVGGFLYSMVCLIIGGIQWVITGQYESYGNQDFIEARGEYAGPEIFGCVVTFFAWMPILQYFGYVD